MLSWQSRESGIECAVSLFLIALGVGLLIPRPGIGLYSLLRSDGYAHLWSAVFLIVGATLCGASFAPLPRVRLTFVILCMGCWIALALRFAEAQLWGAMIQALCGVFLMNACAFRLIHYLRGHHGR